MSYESSGSTSSPYVMICQSTQGPPKTVVSIYGRPTNVRCEYARFPDEQACEEEIRAIKKAIKERREIRNRSYNMSDIERTFKEYTIRAHAFR